MQEDLLRELASYGAMPTEVLSLEKPDYDTINYLDLQQGWGNDHGPDFAAPEAVVEVDGRPLLYVVRADSLVQRSEARQSALVSLRTALACRSEPSYIGIVEHGQITIIPTHYAPDLEGAFTVRQDAERTGFLLRDLIMDVPPPTIASRDWEKASKLSEARAVHDLLLGLLDRVTEDLRKKGPLKGRDGEILSLVGRCLFTCFLIDRKIINERTFPALDAAGPSNAFATPALAALTCDWLDATFNGELLPLDNDDYEQYFQNLATKDSRVFHALSKIMERTTPEGQYHLDCSWIDFSHVPVGLLSQVYESYAHKFFGEHAKQESIHYTPRQIAEYMVEQAFQGIETCEADAARILDPSAGAGVFLVLCFRRLVKEFWKKNKRPPNSHEIRRILNNQIRGLDINDHALKLAALSLYLTAIELDPNPLTGQNLTFDPLMDHVLFNTRLANERFPYSLVLGSLGPHTADDPLGEQYDLVISNVPWTPWTGGKDKGLQKRANELNDAASSIIRGIAARRDPERLADIAANFENPLKAPDVPFVWRAMEWTKPNGVIAFALHARLLFRRADSGASARDSLFKALQVTGILNGTALRQEKVWPKVDAPFCLLFARNNVPSPQDRFYFVSPEIEHAINKKSLWRIDYQSAQPIEFGVLAENPYLLKTLFRGTALDADLVRRLVALTIDGAGSKSPRTLRIKDYWRDDRGLTSGQGFIARGGKQRDAEFLIKMRAKELTAGDLADICLDTSRLKKFQHKTLRRPRQPQIYRAPLVLFSQTPGAKADSIRARISLDDTPVAYNFSFYGYSTHGHPKAKALAKYLLVLAHSDLIAYYTLMTSARYGFERDTIYVEDINDFPIIPIENLTKSQIDGVQRLAHSLCEGSKGIHARINEWVADLYGLTSDDLEIITDTLAVNLPTSTSKKRAQTAPNDAEIAEFAGAMEHRLQLLFDLTNERVRVAPRPALSATWRFLDVWTGDINAAVESDKLPIEIFEELASQEGASRILVPMGPGHLCVGILAQYRYWTRSRARLCAMDLIREHGDLFEMQEN